MITLDAKRSVSSRKTILMQRTSWHIAVLIASLAALLFILPLAHKAYAQPIKKIACETIGYDDLSGNSLPDTMRLRCNLAGEGIASDIVTMIAQDADLKPASDWQSVADFTNAVWVFDYQGDGSTELVISFHRDNTSVVAEIFDIPAGASRVDYVLTGRKLTIRGNTLPKVRMVAPDGWWTKGALINYNLDIFIDGYAYDVLDAARLQQYFKTDGQVDCIIRIRDTDNDGRPDYDWRTIYFQRPIPLIANITPRTYLTVNTKDNEAPIVPTFAWPYIGGYSFGYSLNTAHETMPPPLQMKWNSGDLSAIGEFVSSRGNEGQWFTYSFNQIKENELSTPNFESPFGWYDLAQDKDRTPELAVRFQHYWPNDPYFLNTHFSRSVNNVRYSWDQDNNGFWDYKLGLLGQMDITSTVSLPDVTMRMVPYEGLPEFVTHATWGVAVFVAADNVNAQGEGIYEWDVPDWLTKGYFTGRENSPIPPEDDGEKEVLATSSTRFQQILSGYRGEYQFDMDSPVSLYMSAIDKKLHLIRGDKGIWNIDGTLQMHYDNLDHNSYFDQWRLAKNDVTVAQLNIVGDKMLYSGYNEVLFGSTTMPLELFDTPPPASNGEWQVLRDKILAVGKPEIPTDLRAATQRVGTTTWRVVGASTRDFYLEGNNFSFILELQPGFQVSGQDGLNLQQLQPGSYRVTYSGTFQVKALAPAKISATIELPTNATPVVLEAVPSLIRITNAGGESLANVALLAEARQGDEIVPIESKTVDIPAGTTRDIALNWQPTKPGEWTLLVRLESTEAQVATQAEQHLRVAASKTRGPSWTDLLSSGSERRLIALLILITVAILLGLATWKAQHTIPDK